MAADPAGGFRFPGGDTRTVVIGATGTGKTTFGAWLLSHARFDKRPWVILDYKREELFDLVGFPPLQQLRVGAMPRKRGLFIMSPRPDDDDAIEDWLWKIWEKGNVGLFVDEATLLPGQHAFKAILRQGRSKRIPVIACTQRPVDIEREVFTEANFISVFRVQDERDYKTIRGFIRNQDVDKPLAERHSFWYDVARNLLLRLGPCPRPEAIVERFRDVVPYSWFFGG